jgi:hypothetical protein
MADEKDSKAKEAAKAAGAVGVGAPTTCGSLVVQ